MGYAISLVGSSLGYVILENADAGGNFRLGNMLIVVDDGTGSLSDTLFNSLSIAIQAVRPLGTTFSIQPPQIVPGSGKPFDATSHCIIGDSHAEPLVQAAIENLYNQSTNWRCIIRNAH